MTSIAYRKEMRVEGAIFTSKKFDESILAIRKPKFPPSCLTKFGKDFIACIAQLKLRRPRWTLVS